MKNSDKEARSLTTRNKFRSALMQLAVEKPFAKLTIQDIADQAGLNRTTFYLHYGGVHELLEDCAFTLFDQLRNDIYSKIPASMPRTAAALTPYVESVFTHLEQHEEFYRAMLGRQGDPLFRSLFQRLISELIFEPVLVKTQELTPELEMLLRFFSEGCTGVAIWWLENDKPIPVELAAHKIAHNILPDYLRLSE